MSKSLEKKMAKIAGEKTKNPYPSPKPRIIRIRLPKHIRDGRVKMEVYPSK